MKTWNILLRFLVLSVCLYGPGCNSSGPNKIHFRQTPLNQVLEQYGEPDVDVTFRVNESMPEYRNGLLRIFSESERKGKIIREWKWITDRKTKVIWFEQMEGEWQSIEGLEWGKSVQF